MPETVIMPAGTPMIVIHEALRREIVASVALKHWTAQYRGNPNDLNAVMLHRAWVAMREAVDHLVQMPDADGVALAE